MADEPRITDYDAFWLFYLREHGDPRTRALHYFGTAVATAGVVACVLAGKLWFLIAVPIAGYGPAWIAHFFVEKNKPATFRYPVWSLVSDFRMGFAWLTGQLDAELERAGVPLPKQENRNQR